MEIILRYATTICCLMLLSCTELNAQFSLSKKDITGSIKKYDTLFNGIGPEVYFLPQPPTIQDVINELTIEFKKTHNFDDTLRQASLHLELINTFNKTSNSTIILEITNSNTLDFNQWNKEIENQLELENYPIAIGLLNALAEQFIIINKAPAAEVLLLQGIEIATKEERLADKNILQSNLANLYVYTKKFIEANIITEEQYKYDKKENSITDQANTLVNLAMIQALSNQSNLAESTIIRKAIPLLNKAKDYDNKINAWVKLSQIYILNKKYTEAQWFLIQAQELAELKQIKRYKPTIEYLLGFSKFYQDNLVVSKKELTTALNLAKIAGDKHLELSSTQMLGEINLKQKNIQEAEHFLQSYWKLRNQLF